MKNNYRFFVGLTVSKNTIDYYIIDASDPWNECGSFVNNNKGVRELIGLVYGRVMDTGCKLFFCLKETRGYSIPLWCRLEVAGFDCQLVSAREVRRVMDLATGDHRVIYPADMARHCMGYLHGIEPLKVEWKIDTDPG